MTSTRTTTWTGSLHQTFRLLPSESRSANLLPFLSSNGKSPDEVLDTLPYDRARAAARGSKAKRPDAKRYRDGKQVYQTVGLLYEGDDGLVHTTELGVATQRWADRITEKNAVILARHAAYALAACQLRNPSGAGSRFDESMVVFPFQFIWRAMLQLDGMLSSDELNRGIFKVCNEEDLARVVERIRSARELDDLSVLGEEVVTDSRKNDRIIPWMSLASFGWTLFPDKRGASEGGYYMLSDRTLHIVREAARISHKHRDYASNKEYVEHLSRCAALPQDLR